MRGARTHRFLLLVVAGVVVTVASACSSSGSSTGGTTSSSGPELSTVNLYTVDTPDTAPFWLAEKEGYFKQEGLNVKVVYVQGSGAAIPDIAAHTADFVQLNYVTAFAAEAKDPNLGIKIIADDEQAAPNTNILVVPKDSKITSVAQLAGKKIAFPSASLDIGMLALDEQLRGYGVKPSDYTPEPLSFADMLAPLARGEVDAAFSIQPFITIMESKIGAKPLTDLMSGPTAGEEVTGWFTDSAFAQKYPKTVAAFQTAIEKGQQLAASDTEAVRQLLPANIKGASASISNMEALQTYNTTISVTRLQRLVDLMQEFGYLPKTFNVSSMIVPLPSGS
jgi:NitT/TauT family transport system substrate-binding protein